MNIACTANDRYAKHVGVMLQSLLENRKHRDTIRIFIINSGITESNLRKLSKVANGFGQEITFLTADKKVTEALPTASTIKHITQDTYLRIVLPRLLQKKVTKVLYLDGDLIVKEDLSELWNTDLKDYSLAAVDESCLMPFNNKKRLSAELGLPTDSLYFNAGVMLMNVKKWREEKIADRVEEYLQTHPRLPLMDQDALNAVLHNEWLQLDPKWNYTTCHWNAFPDLEPSILHFCGPRKPWNSRVRFRDEYVKYLHSTKWND